MLVTPLFALILALSGCAGLMGGQTRPHRETPIRPELVSLFVWEDGGICMDKRDSGELLIYIEALERAVGR